MIFVAGGQLDINIGTLLRRLLRRRVNFTDLLVGPELHPLLEYDLQTGILRTDRGPLTPTASFIRHDVFLQQQTTDPCAAPAALNWFYTLKGWELSRPDIIAFNRWSTSRENSKIFNLLKARQVGLQIPATIVTNDFERINRSMLGPLIQKPVAGGELTTTYDGFFSSLETAPPLKRYPRFIQPHLSRPEMRIYRVGDAVLSFSLSSDDIDYRERHKVTLAPTSAPADITEKLVALCDELGLDFAAADFMRDGSTGEWCFLEVNSQPMFAAFDDVVEGKLCDAMIDHLSKHQREAASPDSIP
jgi:hypothetical protein